MRFGGSMLTKTGCRLVLTGALGLALTGCQAFNLLSSGPPARTYDLSPKSTFDEDIPEVDWQLVIEEPMATRALNSDRIAVRTSDYEVGYFSGRIWSDRAPRMVQTRLVESFENSRKIVSVGRRAVGLYGDYEMRSELREFQAIQGEDGSRPRALVRLNVKVLVMPKQTIIASQTFECETEASSETFTDVVAAFDGALGWVLKRVVGWTLTTADAHKNGEPKNGFGQDLICDANVMRTE